MKNSDVTNFIDNASEEQREVLEALRALVFEKSPKVKEQFKWGRPVYGLEKDFCYLKTAKKYVTLGFFDFDKIKTNKDLLEGTGKQMRHIKVSQLTDIAERKLGSMIEEVLK